MPYDCCGAKKLDGDDIIRLLADALAVSPSKLRLALHISLEELKGDTNV